MIVPIQVEDRNPRRQLVTIAGGRFGHVIPFPLQIPAPACCARQACLASQLPYQAKHTRRRKIATGKSIEITFENIHLISIPILVADPGPSGARNAPAGRDVDNRLPSNPLHRLRAFDGLNRTRAGAPDWYHDKYNHGPPDRVAREI
ncbi:hypothetical protein ACU4GD_41685 [Cupriavidus basilensis]